MRKFQVSVSMKNESKHESPHTAKDAKGIILQRAFEILADDEDDAKLKTKGRAEKPAGKGESALGSKKETLFNTFST